MIGSRASPQGVVLNRLSSAKRKRKESSRKTVALSLLAAATVLGCLIFAAYSSRGRSSDAINLQWADVNETANAVALESANEFEPKSQRVVYPYSVVPGGVESSEELRDASAHDPVVSEHYAGFDFQKAHVVKVRQARLAYLSYRIGDKIYWTTKQVSLHAGENLITDGKMTARSRCGNQVSALPQKKHSKEEPAIAQFDQPISGSSMKTPFPDNFHSALESRIGPGWGSPALGPMSPLALLAGGASPLGGGYLPIGSPLAPGSTCTSRSGGECVTTSSPSGPTPGPGSGGPGSGGPGSGGPGSGGPGSGGPGSGGPGSGGPGSGGPGPGPGSPSTPVPEPGTFGLFLAEVVAGIIGWKFFYKRTAFSKIPK
jgi:hypothetical protein